MVGVATLYLLYCLSFRLSKTIKARNEAHSLLKVTMEKEEKRSLTINSLYTKIYYKRIDPLALIFCPWKDINRIKRDFSSEIGSIHKRRMKKMRGKKRK